MTKGGKIGASGWIRAEWRPWLAILLVTLVLTFVNATSDIIDGAGAHWIEPILWEGTSAIIIVGLAPFIGYAMRRWPLQSGNLPVFAITHLGLTIPFAFAHICFIFVTRETAYKLFGARYGFFDDGVAITWLYEWRKDVLVYAAIAATYWMFDYIAERNRFASSPPAEARIKLQDGGATIFLSSDEISHVEAAGNYVEFHTAAKSHLIRGTLASWEARLIAQGFVRVHRSRLVNRTKIAALTPTRSGDLEISLLDGRTVSGSRRYRTQLTG
ncbi:LytR/AlgR family response regulator transcription factor [Parasphingorhabdus sp.]|uniref:LytR/AlgR family response regulator transcription factor n=1 Tax=Parasphingorhabdus sp. TaxID=2709688 RepID=UPI003A8F296D